jgi:hypothetical protein
MFAVRRIWAPNSSAVAGGSIEDTAVEQQTEIFWKTAMFAGGQCPAPSAVSGALRADRFNASSGTKKF